MPLLILLAAALGAGALWGGKKLWDGLRNFRKAKTIGERAQSRQKEAATKLLAKRNKVQQRAEKYSDFIVYTTQTTVGRFITILETLGQRGAVKDIEAALPLGVSLPDLKQFRAGLLNAALGLGKGLSSGALTGVAVAKGSLALVGIFGVASTGTPIAALSGAAASNATLAFLGGGSLAAGGLGVAGGMLMLGGIVVAPVALVVGWKYAAEQEKRLTLAKEYEAEANINIKQIQTMAEFLQTTVWTRIDELDSLVRRLQFRAESAMDKLESIAFDPKNNDHVRTFQQAGLLVKALTDTMRTPILDASGCVTPESRTVQEKYSSI